MDVVGGAVGSAMVSAIGAGVVGAAVVGEGVVGAAVVGEGVVGTAVVGMPNSSCGGCCWQASRHITIVLQQEVP
jgi:hypothetical protein